MFLGYSGTELDWGFLRSERRFRSSKIRKTMSGGGICSIYREEEGYELVSYLDEVVRKKRNINQSLKETKIQKSRMKPHNKNMVTTHLQHQIRWQR